VTRLAAIWIVIGAVTGANAVPRPRLSVVEPWRCFLGARPVALHLEAAQDRLTKVRVAWRVSVERAVLATGERIVLAGPGQKAVVPLHFQCPGPGLKAVVSGRMTATLTRLSDRQPLAEVRVPLRFYPENPFAGRRKRIASLDLLLFDPLGDTAGEFQALGIPFSRGGDPRTAKRRTDRETFVTGAGLSFRDYPGLLEWLVRQATTGANVLCLAPADGSLPVPDPQIVKPERMQLQGASCITALDSKLDATAWPPNGAMVYCSISFSTDGANTPRFAIARNDRGWPWLSLRFPSDGCFVFCGFDLIGTWRDGPVPRYLLARILEWMATKPQTKDVSGRE